MLGFWKKKGGPADKTPEEVNPPVGPVSPPESQENESQESKSWAQRLSAGLAQSSQKFSTGLFDGFNKRLLDQPALDKLEEILIQADLGPALAMRMVEEFSATRFNSEVTGAEVKAALAAQIAAILQPAAKPLQIAPDKKPFVILMVGVNGSGKTTTIGKLAQQYTQAGKKVVLAAGDTFRAAAVEQLQMWGQRTKATVVAKGLNTDSAAVAYEALEAAQSEQADIVLIDTAGRLHNKSNLMEELTKISRVIQKKIPDAPHAVILTLDATIGQNAVAQIEQFNAAIPLTGLVVTKLDGSARGGVVVALAEKFKLPIIAVGVGEGVQDLQAFSPQDFAQALMGLK